MYLILVLSAGCLVAGPVRAAEAPFEELLVELHLNGQLQPDMFMVLRDLQGVFWFDTADLPRLRVEAPEGSGLAFDDRHYVSLATLRATDVRLDLSLAALYLELPPDVFEVSRISAPTVRPGATHTPARGWFANYQLYGQRIEGRSLSGAFAEMGTFSRSGVTTNSVAFRSNQEGSRAVRLDTAWSLDDSEQLRTLTVGDAVSDPGSFGTALRFAGVRWGRDFSIRPDLVTTPLLGMTGTATVPSSVDVFVNGNPALSANVQPGPFIVDNLPVVTGAGDVRVVVRDATGREQVLTQPFYSSPVLLAAGLDQYSFSLGAVRENYAERSFDYGDVAASATWRRGLTDATTLEGHAEMLAGDAWGLGTQVSARLGQAGVASLTTAVGGGQHSAGWLADAAFERRSRAASLAVDVSYASPGFRRAGETDEASARRRIKAALHVGVNVGRFGTSTLAIAEQVFQDWSNLRTVSVTHSVSLRGRGNLGFSLLRSTSKRSNNAAFVTYTQAFGRGRTLASSGMASRGAGQHHSELRATVNQATPTDRGAGWRVGATEGGDYDAWWQQRFEAADLELQASRSSARSGQSVLLSGGVSRLEGTWRAARSMQGSFALVDLGGIADVPVYLENRPVGKTDANGYVVLPNLLPYVPNRITISPEDLPLDAAISARTMVVSPARRSGVLARFPVEKIHPAVFRLALPDDTPVPAGAEVQLNGGHFVVAMAGLTYVTTLDRNSSGYATWPNGSCSFHVDAPVSQDPQPDLGVIRCVPTVVAAQ